MNKTSKRAMGDYQTPSTLAHQVVTFLVREGIDPDCIIEPTCGLGNFLQAADQGFERASKLVGLEINQDYLDNCKSLNLKKDHDLYLSDIFQVDIPNLVESLPGEILVLGNPPWVTNSYLGKVENSNLPEKLNIYKDRGIEAVTGKSNFDISENILIRFMEALLDRKGHLALLCKNSVVRKVLKHFWKKGTGPSYASMRKIDCKMHFDVSADACLFFCSYHGSSSFSCDVFDDLESQDPSMVVGFDRGILISDWTSYWKYQHYKDQNTTKNWRSGIKHDLTKVMLLEKEGDSFFNGLGEKVDVEEEYLFPMKKASDLARDREHRYLIVPQRSMGASTRHLQSEAPKLWSYLSSHSESFEARRSKIYKDKPPFSIFGIGSYTFSEWKIGIPGLYKDLHFRLLGPIEGKPVVVDDTCYTLACDDEEHARALLSYLNSEPVQSFLRSQVFMDMKRPVTAKLLNTLRLQVKGDEL